MANLNRNLLRAMILLVRLCTSLIVHGGVISQKAQFFFKISFNSMLHTFNLRNLLEVTPKAYLLGLSFIQKY